MNRRFPRISPSAFLALLIAAAVPTFASSPEAAKQTRYMESALKVLEKSTDAANTKDYARRVESYLVEIVKLEPGFDPAPYRTRVNAVVERVTTKTSAEDEVLAFAVNVDGFARQLAARLSELDGLNKESLSTLRGFTDFGKLEDVDHPAMLEFIKAGLAANPKADEEVQTKRGVDPRDNRTEKTKANLAFIREEFPGKVQVFCKNMLLPAVRNFISVAYKTKAESLYQASLHADAAAELGEMVVSYMPDQADAKKLNDEAHKAQAALNGELQAKFVTSPFHLENMGKLLLSNKPIELRKEKAEDFKTSFKPGETIYGVFYADGAMHDLLDFGPTSVEMSLSLQVDDGEAETQSWFLDRKSPASELGALTFEIVPDAKASKDPGFGSSVLSTLSRVSPEVHKIKVELGGRVPEMSAGKGLAETIIELDATSGLDKWVVAQRVMNERNLDMARMPKPGMTDPGIAKGMLSAITRAGWKEKPVRAVITDSEWQLYRNLFGVVTQRGINGVVAVKRPDGTCSVFFSQFNQSALSKGWSPVSLNITWSNRDIRCGNIGK